MAKTDPLNHALVPSDRRESETEAIDEEIPDPIPPFDANGFDPDEFERRPVRGDRAPWTVRIARARSPARR